MKSGSLGFDSPDVCERIKIGRFRAVHVHAYVCVRLSPTRGRGSPSVSSRAIDVGAKVLIASFETSLTAPFPNDFQRETGSDRFLDIGQDLLDQHGLTSGFLASQF